MGCGDHVQYTIVEGGPQTDLCLSFRKAEMIVALREKHPGWLDSTSGGGAQADTGRGMPSPALVEADDYVLIHGNGLRPAGVEAASVAIRAMPAYQANPKPIVINEDSPALPNLGGLAQRRTRCWARSLGRQNWRSDDRAISTRR
jgi:hypothetical protein